MHTQPLAPLLAILLTAAAVGCSEPTAETRTLEHLSPVYTVDRAFFILLDRATWLDGEYTVVGQVVAGMDVVDRMAAIPLDDSRPLERIAIERAVIEAR